MFKQLIPAVIAAVLITGCGGDGGDNKSASISSPPPVSSSSSSAASSESSASSVAREDLSFGFSEGIDGWYINAQDAGTTLSSNIELTHDEMNSALAMTPMQWDLFGTEGSENYHYQARLNFDEPIDLSASRIAFTVVIPEAYITAGGLQFQLIVFGESSTEYGDYVTPEQDENGDYVIARETSVADATGIGFQFSEPPSDTTVLEPVLIKSLFIERDGGSGSSSSSSSAPREDLSFGLSEDDGWYINAQSPGTTASDNIVLSHDSGFLAMTPINWSIIGSENWHLQARLDFEEPLDFSESRVVFTVSIPDSYFNDGNLQFQIIVLADSPDYGSGISINDLPEPNENGDYEIARETNVASATGIAFQLMVDPVLINEGEGMNIMDTILVKSVVVERDGGSESSSSSASSVASGTAIDVAVDSGWRANNSGAMAYVDEGVELTATGRGHGVVFDMESQNFVGATLEVVVRISEEYKNSGADIESFAQVKGGDWEGDYCAVANADIVTDEDMTLTCNVEKEEFTAPSEGAQFGVQAPGGSEATPPAGTVIIKSAKLTLGE